MRRPGLQGPLEDSPSQSPALKTKNLRVCPGRKLQKQTQKLERRQPGRQRRPGNRAQILPSGQPDWQPEQPESRAARQSDSTKARQSDSQTVRQLDSRTAGQPDSQLTGSPVFPRHSGSVNASAAGHVHRRRPARPTGLWGER